MLRQLFSIVIAASIVACPLLCKASDSCCGKHRATAESGCCHPCHKSGPGNSTTHESGPADDNSRAPQTCSQCLCHGAVIEDNGLEILHLDISHWVSLPSAEQYAADVFAPQQSIGLFTPLPDDGMNPGRAMRCRMMSLLC